MRIESVERVIERMESAVQAGASVVATDADGTLWSGDVGVDIFETLIAERGIREQAEEALRREATEASIDSTGSVHEVAAKLEAAVATGQYSEQRCYEMMAWVFAGWAVEQAREFARQVRDRKLSLRIHGEMRAIVEWISKRGLELWVVSASPSFMVQAGVELLGIGADRVIGTTPAQEQGRWLARLESPIPYGPGKVQELKKKTKNQIVAASFGDEVFDVEMLKEAKVAVAIRPKARLRGRASEITGLVELERRL